MTAGICRTIVSVLPASLSQPVEQHLSDRCWLLQRGEMTAIRYHDQSCLRYAVSDLRGMVWGGDIVVSPGNDKCRAVDRAETGAGIGTVHDRDLLADERLRAGLVRITCCNARSCRLAARTQRW